MALSTTTRPVPSILSQRPDVARGQTTINATAGLEVTDFGFGPWRQTLVRFTAVPVTVLDTGTYGTLKLFDFPAGWIRVSGCTASLAFTTTSAIASTLNSGVTVNWSVGSAAADGTESGIPATTKLNFIPGTGRTVSTFTSSTTINVAPATVNARLAGAITVLTDNTGGTANNTLVTLSTLTDTPASADALRDDLTATWHVELENNMADLAAKINEIINTLNGAVGVVLDGTSTAVAAYLNIGVPTATDIDADATLAVTGEILFSWEQQGDY